MKEYFYEVHASWEGKRMGSIHSPGVPALKILTPDIPVPEQKNRWTPEQLLAGSLSSCFMRAFLSRAEEVGLNISDYRSQCFIKMNRMNGHYTPAGIVMRPLIIVGNIHLKKQTEDCLEEAEAICCLSKLLSIPVDVLPLIEYDIEHKA